MYEVSILCVSCSVREAIIFEHGCNMSALEHVNMLILCSYVLLVCVNPFFINMVTLGFLVRRILSFNFVAQELYI